MKNISFLSPIIHENVTFFVHVYVCTIFVHVDLHENVIYFVYKVSDIFMFMFMFLFMFMKTYMDT